MPASKHSLFISYRGAALAVALSLPLISTVQANSQWLCESSAHGKTWQCQAGPIKMVNAGKISVRSAESNSVLTNKVSDPNSHHLDWVANRQLSTDKNYLASNCCEGGYVDPLLGSDTSIDPRNSAIETLAKNSKMQGNQVSLSGGVHIKQGYRQLKSRQATVNKTTRIAILEGQVELREPGVLLLSESAQINAENGEAQLRNSQFVFHKEHLRGGAKNIGREKDGLVTLQEGYLSYCSPTKNTWILGAKTIELNRKTGVGTARKAQVKIKGVPVFYAPVISFPIDDRRKNGFLWPEVGSGSDSGLDIATPYYFNVAENYDATLVPRHIGDRGAMAEAEFRYLDSSAGLWTVGGSYLSADKLYRGEHPGADGNRWLSRIHQQGLINQRWRTSIDYTRVSDNDYFGDLGTTSLDVRRQTHLRQIGEVDYLGDDWSMQLRLQQFQTIANDLVDEYKKLPQLTLSKRQTLTSFEPNYILSAEYTDFDHDSKITGERLYSEAGVSFPMRWAAGYITPTAKYKHLSYNLDDPSGLTADESPDVGVGIFSLDSGLYFERTGSWAGRQYLLSLEPRVFYLYTDREDQNNLPLFDTSELTFSYNQLFRESRFSGHDRIDDADQVSVGISTRFVDSESGHEKFSASIGQIFYFEDRQVALSPITGIDEDSNSEIAAEFIYRPSDALLISSSVLWDSGESKVEDGSLQLSIKTDNNAIYNLSYNFDREDLSGVNSIDIEQVDFSTYLPISQHWRFFLRARYGLDSKEFIEDAVGFGYEDCCWSVRIMHARTIDPLDNQLVFDTNTQRDHATYVEFQLKGLGGIGNRISHMLEDMIWGYKEREY